MELHLDVHGCELVGHVSQHIRQGNLAALVRIAHTAIDLFINTELLLLLLT